MKMLIEMDVPEGMDPSTLLDLAQEFAVQLFEDYPDQDDDGEDIELDDDEKENIRVAVSVQENGCTCPNPALHQQLAGDKPIDPAKCAPPSAVETIKFLKSLK